MAMTVIKRRHHLRRAVALVEVAHHGAGEHYAGAGTHRLHDAPADQSPNAARQGAARGANHEQHDPYRHRQPAAMSVADWAPEQLAQAEADEIARLSVDGCVEGFRQGSALDVDRGKGLVDFTQVFGTQSDLGGWQVVIEMFHFRATRNRHNPRLLGQ
jgi:hypothetical protein